MNLLYSGSNQPRAASPRRMGARAATTIVLSLVYPALAQNLLINPGFEAGAQGWQKTDFGGRSIVTSPVHTGARAQQALVSAVFSREVFQEVAVTGDGQYDAAGWLQTSGVGGSGAHIALLWLDAFGLGFDVMGHILRTDVVGVRTGTQAWERVSGTFIAPPGAAAVRLQLFTFTDPDGAGGAWFDDLELLGVPGPMPTPPTFSTYLGGGLQDQIRDVAIDALGNIYLTGGAVSPNFPTTPGAYQTQHQDTPDNPAILPHDVFVTKLDPSGNLVWSTFIGGPNYDRAYAIEIGPDGSVYVAGRAGRGFPVTAGAFQTQFQGGQEASFYGPQDGFVCRLSADGSQLLWASYFGTSDPQIIRDIAVDSSGAVYVGASQRAGTYPPAVAAAFATGYQPLRSGGNDGVVAKVSADGTQVLWATYLGGTLDEAGSPTIRLDRAGNVHYVTSTLSTDAVTTPGAFDRTANGADDIYVAKLSPDGRSLLYATYVGGAQLEVLETHNAGIDAAGNLYCGGVTRSTNFPTTPGAFQPGFGGGGSDAFAFKLSADGTQLLACTYVGGGSDDHFEGVAVAANGAVYLTGGSSSTNFPVAADAFQRFGRGGGDAVAVALSPDLSTLRYSTYIGSSGDDSGRCAAVGPGGAFALAGQSDGSDWPAVAALQPRLAGNLDGIAAKFIIPIAAIGDVNCDGVIDFNDIDPFVLALADAMAYAAQYPACDRLLADANQDGAVDFNDISDFITLLVGG